MTRWLPVVAIVCMALVYHHGSAEACSYPPPFDLQEDLSQGLTGVPVSGVVPIYASVWAEGLTFQPSMTVRDPAGVEVGGALELGKWRVVWRSAAPLAPETTYSATLIVDMFQEIEFTFTTAANDAAPPLVINPGDLHLDEYHRPDRQVCCNAGESSCGGPWQECWTRTVVTEVELWGRFSVDREAARYYQFEGEAEGARSAYATAHSTGEGTFAAHFVERDSDYCLTVRARSLASGADVAETICQNAAALVEALPFEPDQPDYSMCDEPPFDPETGEEIETGGCNTGGGGPAPFLLALVVLGLLRRRFR